MLIDAVQSVGRFIKITAAKVHDKNFLKEIGTFKKIIINN
jgi:hypothetical protein